MMILMVNVPHSLGHLNTGFLVGSTVWKGLGGVALLEECITGDSL